MSEEKQILPQQQDDAPAIADDPVLGKYVMHYPSNRLMLLFRGVVLYSMGVFFIQLFFSGLDDSIAWLVLIGCYSLLALAISWYTLHLWNREVILYERGFTYRQGSRVGEFLYTRIIHLHVKAERYNVMNLIQRDIYNCVMISDADERLTLNNLYVNIAELVDKLEAAITRARMPVIEMQLARGETVEFGPRLTLNQDGLTLDGTALPWSNFAGHRIDGKNLVLNVKTGDALSIPVAELDNALLLLAILKAHA